MYNFTLVVELASEDEGKNREMEILLWSQELYSGFRSEIWPT